MKISWLIPFPEEVPEDVRACIIEKVERRWQRMLERYDRNVQVQLGVGSEFDPQEPDFSEIPGKKKEIKAIIERLMTVVTEISQSEMARLHPIVETAEIGEPYADTERDERYD